MFVLLQAEDGIRDRVRSRGLGDVYKRQFSPPGGACDTTNGSAGLSPLTEVAVLAGLAGVVSVSFTHLTLPSSGLV